MGRIDLAGTLAETRARVNAELDNPEELRPKFATLARKDALIREDQSAALTVLAKRLMRRRVLKSERLTENTLIRVAIDLLLAHADQLRGSTEEELRNSVAPELRDLDTSKDPDSRLPERRTSELRPAGRTASPGGSRQQPTAPAPLEGVETRTPEIPHIRTPKDPQLRTPELPRFRISEVSTEAAEMVQTTRALTPLAPPQGPPNAIRTVRWTATDATTIGRTR